MGIRCPCSLLLAWGCCGKGLSYRHEGSFPTAAWSRARRKRQRLPPKGTATARPQKVPTAAEKMNPHIPFEEKSPGRRGWDRAPCAPQGTGPVTSPRFWVVLGHGSAPQDCRDSAPSGAWGSSGCCSRGG